jgi:hypothetical protein
VVASHWLNLATCQPVIGPLGWYLAQSAANNHVPCVTLAVVTQCHPADVITCHADIIFDFDL